MMSKRNRRARGGELPAADDPLKIGAAMKSDASSGPAAGNPEGAAKGPGKMMLLLWGLPLLLFMVIAAVRQCG